MVAVDVERTERGRVDLVRPRCVRADRRDQRPRRQPRHVEHRRRRRGAQRHDVGPVGGRVRARRGGHVLAEARPGAAEHPHVGERPHGAGVGEVRAGERPRADDRERRRVRGGEQVDRERRGRGGALGRQRARVAEQHGLTRLRAHEQRPRGHDRGAGRLGEVGRDLDAEDAGVLVDGGVDDGVAARRERQHHLRRLDGAARAERRERGAHRLQHAIGRQGVADRAGVEHVHVSHGGHYCRGPDAATEPRHAARRAGRRPRARARVRQPRLPARRRRPDPARATPAGAGSRAGCGSAAGTARRCCSPAASPSCSSSTRRPRSPPGTARARCAGAPTTTASWRCAGERGADAIDARLHAERLDGRARRRHAAAAAGLPDGAFVLDDGGAPWLVRGDALLRWTPAGYAERRARPGGGVDAAHAADARRRAARGLGRRRVPLLHPSAG